MRQGLERHPPTIRFSECRRYSGKPDPPTNFQEEPVSELRVAPKYSYHKDDTKLNTWITTQSTTTRKEVTKSYYDKANSVLAANGLSTFFTFNTATQRKRIVHVTW